MVVFDKYIKFQLSINSFIGIFNRKYICANFNFIKGFKLFKYKKMDLISYIIIAQSIILYKILMKLLIYPKDWKFGKYNW